MWVMEFVSCGCVAFKLSSNNQQVTLFSQLLLCLASKMYLILIQQIPTANKDIQLGRAKSGTEKLCMQNISSSVLSIPQSKDVKLFLTLQLKAYQTDVESKLELSKSCFGKWI